MESKSVEQQPRTIRADQATYDRFKEIASASYGNQGQALAALISLYETEQGKTIIPERKKEIENYQMHLNALSEMFVSSLQLNADAESRARSEFGIQLLSKDKMIIDLQNQLNAATDNVTSANADLDSAKMIYDDLLMNFQEIEKRYIQSEDNNKNQNRDFRQNIEDKDKLIKSFEAQIIEMNFANSNMAKKLAAYDELQSKSEEMKTRMDIMASDLKNAEYEKAKALLDQREATQNEKEKLQNTYHEDQKENLKVIAELQNRLAELQASQVMNTDFI